MRRDFYKECVLCPPCRDTHTPPISSRLVRAQILAAAVKLSAAQFCAGNAQLVAATTRTLSLH